MIRVALVGATGRTGSVILTELQKSSTLTCTQELTSRNQMSNISDINFDVIIDFSTKNTFVANLQFAVNNKIPIVIGTTGIDDSMQAAMQNAAQSIPVFYAANMSIGANILYKLIAVAATALPQAEIAITELHHKHKKDVPSGTAKAMALAAQRPVQMSAVRLGEAIGEHTALFALPQEMLTISHRSSSRVIYAEGALMAAAWLVQQPSGFYGMQQLLNLE